ncbi:hypothetical protein FRC09_017610 [Ceratobasidium sp. 395]|nr:hypothetical protein FRC09_017610 [Ceratobasidium sp. 395]
MPPSPYFFVPPPPRYRGTPPVQGPVPFTYDGLAMAMEYTEQLSRIAIREYGSDDPEARAAHARAYVQQNHVANVVYQEEDANNHPPTPPPAPPVSLNDLALSVANILETVLSQTLTERFANLETTINATIGEQTQLMQTKFEEASLDLVTVREHFDSRLDTLEKQQRELDERIASLTEDLEAKTERLDKATEDLNRRFNEGIPEHAEEKFQYINQVLGGFEARFTEIQQSIGELRGTDIPEIVGHLASLDRTQRILINSLPSSEEWLEIPNNAGSYPTHLPQLLPLIGSVDVLGALSDIHVRRYAQFYGVVPQDQMAEPSDSQPLTNQNRLALLSALRSYLTQPRVQ